MKMLKPSLLAITAAALVMPAALTATTQCVPLKPDVWEQTCMADKDEVFSALAAPGLSNDWLPSLDLTAPWLDQMTPLLDFNFDVTDDVRLAPFEFDEPQDLSRETPSGEVNPSREERS